MKLFKKLFKKNEQNVNNKKLADNTHDQYLEIGKLVKQARIKKNISIEELSRISRIPEYTIKSIENNIEKFRPKYPFIRSILFKLEECLSLRKNILVSLLINDEKNSSKNKNKFIVNKLDLIDTWHGNLLYFFILILSIFLLERYFVSNFNIIEIQKIEISK